MIRDSAQGFLRSLGRRISSRRAALALGLLLVGATLLVYAQTCRFGFMAVDDPIEISGNPRPVSWYLRLTVKDQRGIVARVAEVIARHDINIDSLEQEPHVPKDRVSFVITVEPVSEPTIRAAVDAINAFEFMVEPVLLLRVE